MDNVGLVRKTKLSNNPRIKISYIFVNINMKYSKLQTGIILLLLFFNSGLLLGQNLESENARSAIKAGSSKELVEMLDKQFELILFEEKYNRSESEAKLKDFFIKNPAKDFKYVHKGLSKDGSLSYSIGHYETSNSKFRIVIRFKRISETYQIHKMEVSKL